MAKFALEWRQFRGEGQQPAFVHRRAYATSLAGVGKLANALGNTAWHREFRVLANGHEVFTSLHHIDDWVRVKSQLPAQAAGHIWLEDLRQDLNADRFLDIIITSTSSAVSARVLRRDDADTFVSFARTAVRRPRL